jgi:hypothetical protein
VSESRAAFDELLATLRTVGDRFAGADWGLSDPADVAEGLRVVTHLLAIGLETQFEDDAAHPMFRAIVTPWRKALADQEPGAQATQQLLPGHEPADHVQVAVIDGVDQGTEARLPVAVAQVAGIGDPRRRPHLVDQLGGHDGHQATGAAPSGAHSVHPPHPVRPPVPLPHRCHAHLPPSQPQAPIDATSGTGRAPTRKRKPGGLQSPVLRPPVPPLGRNRLTEAN